MRAQVNDHCPPDVNGPVLCSHSTMRPAFHDVFSDQSDYPGRRKETLDEAMRSTRWWPLVRSKGLGAELLTELLAAFIEDIQCCHASYAMDHFSAQSVFAMYAMRGIDVVLPMSNLDAGLKLLADRVPSKAPAGQCTLSDHINSAAASHGNNTAGETLPSSSALRAALTEDQIRQLCQIYAQDYACFDLQLPPACPQRTLSGISPFAPAPPHSPPPVMVGRDAPAPSFALLNMPPIPPGVPFFLGGDVHLSPSPPPLLTPLLLRLNPWMDQESLARNGSLAIFALLFAGLAGTFILRRCRERVTSRCPSRLRAKSNKSTRRVAAKRRPERAGQSRGAECTAIVIAPPDDADLEDDPIRPGRGQRSRSTRFSNSRRQPRRPRHIISRRSRELLPTDYISDDEYSYSDDLTPDDEAGFRDRRSPRRRREERGKGASSRRQTGPGSSSPSPRTDRPHPPEPVLETAPELAARNGQALQVEEDDEWDSDAARSVPKRRHEM